MAGAFKRITAKSRTRHTAHKEYDIKLGKNSFTGDGKTGSGSFDGLNLYGVKNVLPVFWSASQAVDYSSSYHQAQAVKLNMFVDPSSIEEPATEHDLYNSVRGRYYKEAYTPGFESPKILHPRSHIISIPHLMAGDGIKPGTFEFSSASAGFRVVDDGKGRLFRTDIGYTSQSTWTKNLAFQLYTANAAVYDKRPRNFFDINTAPRQAINGALYNVDTIFHEKYEQDYTQPTTEGYSSQASFQNGFAFSGSKSDSETWLIGNNQPYPPNNPLGWFPSLPDTCVPVSMSNAGVLSSTAQPTFGDMHIFCKFVIDLNWSPSGASTERVIWSLGQSDDGNNTTNVTIPDGGLRLILNSSNVLQLQKRENGKQENIATGTVIIGQKDHVTVSVKIIGSLIMLSYRNHDGGPGALFQGAASNQIHCHTPDEYAKTLSIGAGFYKTTAVPNINQQSTGQTAVDAFVLHSPVGMALYDFRIWDSQYQRHSAITGEVTTVDFVNQDIAEVGNIFYEDGVVVLDASREGGGTNENIVLDGGIVSFKNTVEREEFEYVCMIQDTEFNMSQHPTLLKPDSTPSNPTLKTFVSGGLWDPYITTIGLYDDNSELLAIGKLGRPIRKVEHYDQTFIVRFDR